MAPFFRSTIKFPFTNLIITSPHNEKLKEVRKLNGRRRERSRLGRFVAEGEDLLAAADAAGWEPVARLVAAGSGLQGEAVVPELLASASELGSGTRALAIYEERWAPAATGPVCVYLHGVRDPGNIGTVLRSAQAFGAACLALGPRSADPFSPKAVRASMGAIFDVSVVRVSEFGALPGTRLALDAGAQDVLWTSMSQMDSPTSKQPVTIVIGGEREGLPDDVLNACDHVARIPIDTHSLNAAVAATIALYELATRRITAA
jgi:RNA methyltransferase, TrmH family